MLSAMRGRISVFRAVLRSGPLRRLEAAYLLFSVGEWASWVAVIVYAYDRGRAGEAGLVVFIQLLPSVVGAPAVASLGDRFPRSRVLLGTYAAQAVLMMATAAALALSLAAPLVYLLATMTATAVALSRPVHASLLPEVVESPDDLTAANVISGTVESAGSLLGPLGAGILVALGGPGLVLLLTAAGNVLSSLAVLGLARRASRPPAASEVLPAAPPSGLERDERQRRSAAVAELAGGLTAIWSDHRLRAVVIIATWATFLVGALDIFYAVLAIDLMGIGESGVGFVGALGGAGATAGSAAGLALVGRERLGVALVASAILFGAAIAAIAAVTGSIDAGLLLVVAGIGSGLTYVAAQTLVQRLAGDDVLSRVFGVLQGLMMGATALGALAAPALIGLVGERAAFAFAGLSLPLVIVLLARAVVVGDRMPAGRATELRLLRGVPMFAPLAAPVLELLAAGLSRSSHPAGTIVVREGDPGDRFYVVAGGSLRVAINGIEARRLGPGDGFGEIALVRDLPRTASVTALEPVSLLEIDRGHFLAALTGQPRSRALAVALVDDRLAGPPSVG